MRQADRPVRRAMGLALALAGAVLALDQATKWLVLQALGGPTRVIELTGFFNLVLVFNTGISFGLLRGAGSWAPWALGALALAVVAALFVWLRRQPEPRLALTVGLIAGGALGNVIDRARFGAVVDFLDFHLGGWHWPAFNVADSAITVGVALLVLDGLFGKARRGNT